MERSSSAPAGPVLSDEDYYLPCHGVGDTGHKHRDLYGPWSKDTGEYSSRINQIIKQAQKYPGPGKYIGHDEWKPVACQPFPKGTTEYKPLHKGPDPTHYERKDLGQPIKEPCREPLFLFNAIRQSLSNNKRILYVFFPKVQRRSCFDGDVRRAAKLPAPGQYFAKDLKDTKCFTNKLNPKAIKITPWDKETVKTISKKVAVEEIGPGQYKPNWDSCMDRLPNYSVPKEPAANFLDKAVKEKMIELKPKQVPLPGPGHYNMQNFPLQKTSRGTYHSQLRGLSRNPASGYL